MHPVIHFEMPTDDRERVAKFYNEVFGWEMKMFGEELGNYMTAMTTESDEKGPKNPGAINGGFFPKSADNPSKHPSVVIAVDNIIEHIKLVEAAGGKVLHPEPMNIPDVGLYSSFIDTEGNLVSMLQPRLPGE